MNELWAALLGAVIGGAISATQTWRVLRHEVVMARQAAEASRQADRQAAVRAAASRMLDALAVYTTIPPRSPEPYRWFGGMMGTAEHARLDERVMELARLDASAALTLQHEYRERWRNLLRLANWAHRGGEGERPNYSRYMGDLVAYGEYVRRTLVALLDEKPPPVHAEPPDHQRSDGRVWGWKPPSGSAEPDLSDWIKERSRPTARP